MSERRAKQARRIERRWKTGSTERHKVRVGLLANPEPGCWDPEQAAKDRAKERRGKR